MAIRWKTSRPGFAATAPAARSTTIGAPKVDGPSIKWALLPFWLPLPVASTACGKRKWEVASFCSIGTILLFDRDHPFVPTCTRDLPTRAAAVKDGRLRATVSRSYRMKFKPVDAHY